MNHDVAVAPEAALSVDDRSTDYAVEMVGVSKSFGTLKALDDVDFRVRKGTIHALLGENGAGKSTLMKILYGLYTKDAGHINIMGEPVDIRNPKQAITHGIGMVHQHFMLVENMTIAENIVLGSEPTKSFGRLDREKMNATIDEFGRQFGLEVNPTDMIYDVSVATQQRVEILKALYRGVDILILDEPTAVLTPQEIEGLIHTMRRLVDSGKTIIIITHKLREIMDAADACTIIRRGVVIDTVNVADVTETELAEKMVGREVHLTTEKDPAEPGDVVMAIDHLTVKDHRGIEKVKDLSLHVRHGEILAIAGVDGNGQTELIEAITGLRNVEAGTIVVNGQNIENGMPADVHEAGIRTIHEDRHKRGLVLDFRVGENLILESYKDDRFSGKGRLLSWRKVFDYSNELIDRFDVRPRGCATQLAKELSGGNQQKVIIAREVEQDPDLLIACQPTRGLDVGAIEFVRNALVEQRDRGRAILLISLELDEVLDLADRINVIYDGQIVADLDPDETDEKAIGLLMAGGGR
ncbi:MAG: ABC transporter ATP-binding protein [Saccharofermentanales bacterium]